MLTFSALTFKEASAGDSITVSVEVEGFRNENGLCRLLLYENENGFPDSPEDAKLMLSRKVEGKILDFIFKIIPGKPKEGFGTSNNPKIHFSPPGFEESAIEIDKKNNYIKIKIKYL